MNDEDAWVDEIETEILDYIRANPSAAESRDGIFQFWILQSRFLRGLRALDQALARLVAQGKLEVVRKPDGGALYRAPLHTPGAPTASHRRKP